MCTLRQVLACWFLFLGCAVISAQGGVRPEQPLGTLTTARAAHSLTAEQAARAYPIHLRAVVTYYEPHSETRHGSLFVHDETGAIFVWLNALPLPPLKPGSLIDLQGVSRPGQYAPVVGEPRIRLLGETQLPAAAIRASMAELLSGKLDGQWVEIEGIVHSISKDGRNVIAQIATTEGNISVLVPSESGANYDALIDARVRVHGNEGPLFNSKLQMVGVRLLCPGLKQVTVLQPAPPDPFALPVIPISHLLRYMPGVDVLHRVHVRGRVTLQWPGRTLCIQQETGGLCMQAPQAQAVRVGELVDIVGFPGIANFKATLENATFRAAVGALETPDPARIDFAAALRGEEDQKLVEIEGNLVGIERSNGDLNLMIQSGKTLFSAILPKPDSGPMPPLKEGSIVRLTGICSAEVDGELSNLGDGAVRFRSASLRLRSPSDVQVLRIASWWTIQHTLAVLSAVCALAIAALIWVVILRSQVEQQIVALRESEERLRHLSHHDVVTGLPNRLLFNDRMEVSLKRTERFNPIVGIFMIDVDHFKEVNDEFGHQAGDKLLREVGQRIARSVRKTDTVARFGGDEFAVLLPDLESAADATAIAAKIVDAFSTLLEIDGRKLRITVSVGVCTYPQGGADTDLLLKNSDVALYSAKALGRNNYQVFSPISSSEDSASGI